MCVNDVDLYILVWICIPEEEVLKSPNLMQLFSTKFYSKLKSKL